MTTIDRDRDWRELSLIYPWWTRYGPNYTRPPSDPRPPVLLLDGGINSEDVEPEDYAR